MTLIYVIIRSRLVIYKSLIKFEANLLFYFLKPSEQIGINMLNNLLIMCVLFTLIKFMRLS